MRIVANWFDDLRDCMRRRVYNYTNITAQGKIHANFTFRWDCADGLGIVKKLSCFGQEYRENRDDITWKKIAEVEYKTVDSKEGEAEAEGVNKRHDSKERSTSIRKAKG